MTLCGVTAKRDPKTGQFEEPVCLYTDETPETRESERKALADFGAAAARIMRQYQEGCREAGISL